MKTEDFWENEGAFVRSKPQHAKDGIAVLPGGGYPHAATAKQDDSNNCNDEGGIVLFLGFFGSGRQLFVHILFSWNE
jgi:hypothetical protein